MIEKFTDDEIKTILAEVKEKQMVQYQVPVRNYVYSEKIQRIFKGKPFAKGASDDIARYVSRIIAPCLNNMRRERRKCNGVDGIYYEDSYYIDTTIRPELVEEYERFRQDILKLLEKYNRPYNNDCDKPQHYYTKNPNGVGRDYESRRNAINEQFSKGKMDSN